MGLSAEELSAETLFPGDTIEYYSMAFVSGDPRGYRVAKVLKVLKDENEFPLRLESQEMLPMTLMIRRRLDRHDDAIDPTVAKWRKIRTFKLVTGEVHGRTRADRLNAGLQQSVTSAMNAAKATLAERKQQRKHLNSAPSKCRRTSDPSLPLQPPPAQPRERFQQQQLSFATSAPATKHESRDATSRKSTPPPSSQSPLRHRRHRVVSPTALQHKPPRCVHKTSTRTTASRYFASNQRAPQAPPPRKTTALLNFVEQLEERKSARATTLDEYLALDQKQQAAIQQLTSPTSRHEPTTSCAKPTAATVETENARSGPPTSKWGQARARFRAKQSASTGPATAAVATSRMRTDSQLLGKWLGTKSSTTAAAAAAASPKPTIKPPTQAVDASSRQQQHTSDAWHDRRKRKRSVDFASPSPVKRLTDVRDR